MPIRFNIKKNSKFYKKKSFSEKSGAFYKLIKKSAVTFDTLKFSQTKTVSK